MHVKKEQGRKQKTYIVSSQSCLGCDIFSTQHVLFQYGAGGVAWKNQNTNIISIDRHVVSVPYFNIESACNDPTTAVIPGLCDPWHWKDGGT